MYYGHDHRISPLWHIDKELKERVTKRHAKNIVDRNEEDDERISKENKMKKGEES